MTRDPDASLRITCSSCGAKMRNHDFDAHHCPASVKPNDGETWNAYKDRASEVARKWREANNVVMVKR